MAGIMRLGFVEVQATELEKTGEFYKKLMGLQEVKKTADKIYFKCWDEWDHHSYVLKKADSLGLVKIGWKVASADDLGTLEKSVEKYGVRTKRVPKGSEPGLGEAVAFEAPSGQTMYLYHEMEHVGRGVKVPDIKPNLPGVAPPHLDHMVIAAEDVDEAVKFMKTALGFRVSEQVLDAEGHSLFSFLVVHGKPHDIAFSKGPKGKFHHTAFFLDDWNEVGRAAATLADGGVALDVPPSKHSITRGQTIYFRDPSGNRLETFAGGYSVYPDFPTITWPIEHLPRALFNFGGPSNLDQFMQWI